MKTLWGWRGGVEWRSGGVEEWRRGCVLWLAYSVVEESRENREGTPLPSSFESKYCRDGSLMNGGMDEEPD